MVRVAVTTSADGVGRVAGLVAGAGLTPVALPCIRIEPAPPRVLAGLREAAASADLILVTSPRAVRLLWPEGGMPRAPVAAVGEATADAVRSAGGRVELAGEAGAEVLVDRLIDGGVEGRTIVFPRARAADPTGARRLVTAGARIVSDVAYRTIPVAPGPDPVAAALFGSPSAVTGWISGRPLDRLVLAAMGGRSAAALVAAGRPPDVVAERSGFPSLVAALADHLAERSAP
ncbi:MAG: uroporphyrinogen-III synthase [Acidimicrobiia bacterium]|jgi:uroporphyrinogen III methyltransferase / synthase